MLRTQVSATKLVTQAVALKPSTLPGRAELLSFSAGDMLTHART
jgi:hypothetical protein